MKLDAVALLSVKSVASNPVTLSLNVTVTGIGLTLVGSVAVVAKVTDGDTLS